MKKKYVITMLRVFILSLLGGVFSLSSYAFEPSAEQVKMFQSLSDAEKRALIQSESGRLKKERSLLNAPQPFVETIIPLVNKDKRINDNVEQDIERDVSRLKPFGFSLFAGQPTTFAPVNNIPIPTDYILGPGDQLNILIFGSKNDEYQLVVDRNGQITMPYIGPVSVAGMHFSEAKSLLLKKTSSLGIGVQASVTMGELRSFRVFVLGESRTPGSYLVSGMATITHALYVSGGINDVGSYRKVQLKRRGKVIKTLDLYDLLLSGNTVNDVRLQPGDAVFIPKLKKQVALLGEVYKPALYELRHEKTLFDVLQLAGGSKPNAYQKGIEISRVVNSNYREHFTVDMTQKKQRNYILKNGDIVRLEKIKRWDNSLIKTFGALHRMGEQKWRSGMRLMDLISSRKRFKNDADIQNLLVKRQEQVAGDYKIFNVNWIKAEQDSLSKDNILLKPRDEVFVLSKIDADIREQQLNVLLDELKQATTYIQPYQGVSASGMFKFSGEYPLVQNMTVQDLVSLSGGLKASAMLKQAELYRFVVENGEKREVERIFIDLNKAIQGDLKHNLALKPYDNLMVKQLSYWGDTTRTVIVKGEVVFPGSYTIKPGETLEQVLVRAGGFTQWAAPEASVFTRKSLQEQEAREMSLLADELEKNMMMALKSDAPLLERGAGESIVAMGQSLIAKIKSTPAIGRLVVGLDSKQPEKYQATMDLELREGDQLIVPKRASEVVVMGEVSRPASILFQEGLTIEEYIRQSGGVTKLSDDDSVYVVHSDGSIEKYVTSFFGVNHSLEIRAGDTIVVPMDVERMNPIVTWTAVSKVLSNFAVTAATLKTVGVIN
ncbi:Capsular polysaccharide biosynthesis/export periplasmic protein WcbA; Capsular polysaccharide export system protein KpsC [hydrothermal vent metagenome]|uniref:Capsular polysaccharide biosynthesis/export periplasmic protein WcbA Capsular polysaccharide export system protein KpsC n=1 Tax=hydrothermal vent metagenome TaxID=652676 RepID=A0A3B0WEE0_9ZZZZ